jgi:hypothetical protein
MLATHSGSFLGILFKKPYTSILFVAIEKTRLYRDKMAINNVFLYCKKINLMQINEVFYC